MWSKFFLTISLKDSPWLETDEVKTVIFLPILDLTAAASQMILLAYGQIKWKIMSIITLYML